MTIVVFSFKLELAIFAVFSSLEDVASEMILVGLISFRAGSSDHVIVLFIICYLLFVICYLLFVICYLLFVICYLLFVICYLLFVICLLLEVLVLFKLSFML